MNICENCHEKIHSDDPMPCCSTCMHKQITDACNRALEDLAKYFERGGKRLINGETAAEMTRHMAKHESKVEP